MNVTLPILSLLAAAPTVPLPTNVPGAGQDTLILLVAISALGLILLGVFTAWMKSRHSRHRHHRRRQANRPETQPAEVEKSGEEEEGEEEDGIHSHRHRRRRRRRDHRPRNPTLAETGGLPPPRPEGQAPTGL